jgi:hypothetical protein
MVTISARYFEIVQACTVEQKVFLGQTKINDNGKIAYDICFTIQAICIKRIVNQCCVVFDAKRE